MLLCNPHNPVGRVWPREELKNVAAICRRHDVLVVADEIHADITFPGNSYTPFATLSSADSQNCITCISPAKSFNIASVCSSFMVIINDKKRQAFQAENSRLTVNKNNAFASVAMEAAYRHDEPWLKAAMKYLEQNVDLIRYRLRDLDGIKMIEPEGTFLLWLDFRTLDFNRDELTDLLRKKAKWAVTRGHAFGEEGAGFARLNVACTRAKLKAALDQLERAIKIRV